jgi:hypothetical protein
LSVKITIQTDSYELLKEAAASDCDSIRFGSEFCELKIPTSKTLENAYELVRGEGRDFTYVTPRLSNEGIERLRSQLPILDEWEDVRVVVNDMGALNVLKSHGELHLGRQLVFVPARCPWSDEIIEGGGLLARRWVGKVFSSTSLNHRLTIELYRKHGVRGADFDWIPRIFPSLEYLVERKLDLSLYLYLTPVVVSRRCHTARFVGESSPERCSKPCNQRVFLLESDALGLQLFLSGNVVFNYTKPSPRDAERLAKTGVAELVLTMNSITGINSSEKINDFITNSELVKAFRGGE